ncbi:IucA/IucC family siderophore biosynthesis protein [Streptomyces sp. P38-E01]|uniref:IucA/IucC family siderophore biosynthesis protein n=1 Tax=Streptomyces tardus TaxID=2780544 RepID=A0A949JR39_9ACTN|nr:IucA/IucC family protein [Streptomyces tardus]MBU7600714.1 IucA/IucC family siderophore biosynthesis protein [Streptomyces tardus]
MNPSTHQAWQRAGERLLLKAVEEFAYEELLVPVALDPAEAVEGREASYRLEFGAVHWIFRARRGTFGTWRVTPGSAVRHPAAEGEAGPERLLLDARAVLDWDGSTTAEVLRELTATRRADALSLAAALPAAALADLDHLDLEAHQDGHPCMLLNKGRLGFSAADTAAYAPESAGEVRLVWVAAHTSLAAYSGVPGLDAETLLGEELDPGTRQGFADALRESCAVGGFEPEDFVWLPVHPFHWDEAVRTLYCAELAEGRIVHLGEGPDRYRPLQSIRTLANLDHPGRRNVKVPLMIRNTLVWRGLSPGPTHAAPDISHWLHRLRAEDPFLSDELRFHPLGEVAAVSVRHPLYESVADAPYRYHELFGAVWREPVSQLLGEGERARTMAALLKTGSDGATLVGELVNRSGLSAAQWLDRFLGALLPGLLHHLYRYGVAFCPHGENTVILYDARDVPIGIAVKDFAEDVNLLPGELPEYAALTDRAREVLLRWPAHELAHSLLSAVFAGHFRFFAPLLADELDVPEAEFWSMVRREIERYHDSRPELADRFPEFGLLAADFDRVALNREQLLGGGFHDRAERDEGFDVVHGRIANPLAAPGAPAAPVPPAAASGTSPRETR